MWTTTHRKWTGMVVGLGVTSLSLSSGFIWACGTSCVSQPVLWTGANQPLLVFGASLLAWWGYLIAHYAWTGQLIDNSAHDDATTSDERDSGKNRSLVATMGVVIGVSILIIGMVIGVFFIREGNHLMTNVGGIFFLSGFVIAHYAETGTPL